MDNQAPSMEQLGQEQEAAMAAPVTEETVAQPQPVQPTPVAALDDEPTVCIYYCGGCGLNMYNLTKDKVLDARTVMLDTSTANLREGNEKDALLVDGCFGSGNVQATNVASIKNYINQKVFAKEKPADINVVVFSMSGGSGSIIAPLLVRELNRQHAIVIAMGVADFSSKRSIENTANTMQSLINIAERDKIYLPMSFFDNSKHQSAVDKAVTHRLQLLVSFLRTRIERLDKTDKMFWLRPDKTVGAAPGVYSYHIAVGENTDHTPDSGEVLELPEQSYTYHSVVFVSPNIDDTFKYRADNLYRGVSTNGRLFGLLGFDIPQRFIADLNDQLNEYQSVIKKKQEVEINNRNFGGNDDDGLIF